MKRKLLIGGAVVLSVAILLLVNLRNLGGRPVSGTVVQGPAGAPLVRVERVAPRSLNQEVLAPGTVEAGDVREIRAPFTTKEVRLHVGIGDRVKQGQVLAELYAEDLAAQVTAQEAAVARAEASLASLRLQQEQQPLQLAQRLEQARAQLLQAEDGLKAASQQEERLRQRVELARAQLELLQARSGSEAAQVEAAQARLMEAEAAYLANPMGPGLKEAYDAALAAYDEALRQSEEAAKQTAAEIRRAWDELEAAEQEYERAGGENGVAVELARSQVESARLALQMAEAEAAAGGTIAAQVRAAEADLAAARSMLNSLRAKLAEAAVTAPADGTVLMVALKDGQPAQEGQVLLTLGDMDTMKVSARVDEVDIGKVKVGDPLSVRSHADPQMRFTGEVVRVAAQTSGVQGTGASYFEVEGRVRNMDGKLRSGMSVEATIRTASRESAIVVGLASVREEGSEAYVLVVEDFKVKLRPVKLGLRTQTEVEVVEGLNEGETIVVGPFTLVNQLEDGSAVRIEMDAEAGETP